jgi:hypothetical protein
MSVGDIEYFNNQPQVEDSRYSLTSHFNIKVPDANHLPLVFESAFKGKLEYMPVEADELSVYKYGIVIRPEFGKVTADIEHEILLIMEELNVGGEVVVVHESPTVDSIHIKLGSNDQPLLGGDVSNLLVKFGGMFQDIWNMLESYWDGMIWMAEWDVDEEMSKSP